MNPIFIATIAAVALAGYLGWQAYQHRSKHQNLTGTETTSTGALGPLVGTGTLVECKGTAQPGPRGVLKSPVSKTDCVWHMHRVTRRVQDVYRDSDGNHKTRTQNRVAEENRSAGVFHLRDAEGEVAVRPGEVEVLGAEKTVSEFREAEGATSEISFGSFQLKLPNNRDGQTLGYQYEEWVLPVNTDVFVQGAAVKEADRIVITEPTGREELVITTQSEDDLVDDARMGFLKYGAGAVGALLLAVVLLVYGVVR